MVGYSQLRMDGKFGDVLSATADVSIFDQVGIGTSTPNANELQIGSGSTVIVSAAGSLGVGVTFLFIS